MSLTAAFEGSTGLNEAHRREIEGRVGTAGGRAVRSFHINFGSVKASAPAARGWSQAIDYAARQGKYAKDGEDREEGPDVLHVAGSPDALREACKTIDAGVRQRRGKTAERILVKETVELPSDVEDEPAAWKASAEAIVADWRKRGHEAVAAVHLHGEERDHPHLHVLVAARPVNADGGVDRSRRLLVGKAAVKDERANAAERINEACEPKIHFHPGKLKEIGIERAAKKRIPQGEFRARRAEIRAAPEKAAAIEASMYAMSAAERAPLHVERTARYEARKPILEAAKAAGRWPPKSQRREQQIIIDSWRVTYEDMKAEKRQAADDANYWIVEEHQAKTERDEQRLRADTAEASVTAAKEDRKALETELNTAEGRARELEELNKRQTKYVTDWHGNRKVELPDLATVEGQSAAWENMRAWQAKALKKARDEAGAALTAATTAEKERDEQRLRADTAEDRADELEAGQVEPLRLTERQRKMLVGVCGRKHIEGDPVHDAQVQLLAFAARHEEEDARDERKRREAAARVQTAAQAEEARQQAAADAARRADLLKDNPYAETPQDELRKGYREDVRSIEMHQVILNRARARKVWPESEEAIANAGERQKQRRAVAEAKGWDIGQPPRTQSNTQRGEGR